jgi:serine/threonine-protein kinase haspin
MRINQDHVDRLKLWESQLQKLKATDAVETVQTPQTTLNNQLEKLSISKSTDSIDTIVVEESSSGHDTEEKSIQDLLLLCGQSKVYSFTDYFESFPLKKIGEASYSDVYLSKSNQAIKIIPIGNDDQLSIHAAWLELATTREIGHTYQRDDPVSNFVQLEHCGVIQDLYHEELVRLWDQYDEIHQSENVDPRDYASTQYYLILSMEYAGSDLESTLLISNLKRVYSLVLQVIFSLCQAELLIGFEHRDLHWGNVLVSSYRKSSMNFVLKFPHTSHVVQIPTGMIKVTLIDFTLARFCNGIQN